MAEFPQIPGFEFHGVLGRGGMAIVYAATQFSLGRRVAIKVVEPDAEHAAQHLQRLENEARGLAGLQHPNIVELYDFGHTAQGAMYYVMPLLPGGDLTRRPKPMPPEALAVLLDRLLEALAHAHAADIVHRDIKPENILFDRNDRPLLADFGAALMRRYSRLTGQGVSIGSTGYMSPEQARGIEVDARSDLYSVAVVAFEMLTGRLPFDGPDALSIALAQCEQPVPRLPPELAHWQPLFDRALAVDPRRRYASAQAMRAALHALHQPRSQPAPGRQPWRHRWATAALTLGLALAALAWWLGRERPVSAESIEASVAAGALTPPHEPNAVDLLVQARAEGLDPARLGALRDQVLARLAGELQGALPSDDPTVLPPAWHRWRGAVMALGADTDPQVVAEDEKVERALAGLLERAVAGHDRDVAAPALAILNAWPSAPKTLQALAERVRALPMVGERFADRGGPELVLARKPGASGAGLAVMSRALEPALYRAFVADRGRAPAACTLPSPSVQGCIDLATGSDLAEWLSRRTGQRYRVPTRDELAATISLVAAAPAQAWTSTCNDVRTLQQRSAARRTWSGVRKLFGREREAPRYTTRCAGHFALPLDGRGESSRALEDSAPDTTVVLVREVAPAGR